MAKVKSLENPNLPPIEVAEGSALLDATDKFERVEEQPQAPQDLGQPIVQEPVEEQKPSEIVSETEKVLGGVTSFGESEQGKAALEDLSTLRSSLGLLTPEERARIEQTAKVTGAQFDRLIAEAKEQKRLQLPKAVIRSGERGGLLQTGTAGLAAISPTERTGFEGFIGVGGSLANIEDTFNRNINQLKADKIVAVNKSRELARIAIRTGKKEDLQALTDAVNLARQLTNDQNNLELEKLEVMRDAREAAKTEAVEPFFKGSDIIDVLQTLPAGESTSLTDPNTGQVYELQGIGGKAPNVITATDDRGIVRGIDKNTGDVLWEVDAGKSKSTPITIINQEQQSGALTDAATRLNASIGEDGFFNTDVYSEERTKFIEKTGKPDLFDDTFKQKLNPDDPGAKRFLTKSEIEVAGEGEGDVNQIIADAINEAL